MLVAYHAAALRELSEITNYYEWQLPNLGLDFLNELERALSLVAENGNGLGLRYYIPHMSTTTSSATTH